ncbi:hypothetical protein [Pelagibius sp. Alg239-R121]|uniref:hypothetical protein n=1 Tax=Pelagibius sp. Alg239-R121 TaxID=2993448 RepID=UPI0024A63792|nr:hypothetical protein [Pelagibius sp. Alg239-R121]
MIDFLSSLLSAGLLLSAIGLVGALIHWSIKNDASESIGEQTGWFKMKDFEAEKQLETENKLRTVQSRLHDQDFRS